MRHYLTTPFKRRWLFPTALVVLASLVMVGLGFWQLGRHHERMAYIEGVIAEVNDTPFVLTGASSDDQYEERIFHQVQAQGVFDFDNQILVKNKFYEDVMGYHVVTPFLIEGGNRAVLVDRGWVSPDEVRTPEDARKFDEPGLTSILGRIVASEESKHPPPTPQVWWYRVDVANIGRQLPYEVLPYYVALLPTDEPQTKPPFRDPPHLKLDPGVHFGYAVQWFLFALLLPLFYLWLVVRTDRLEPEELRE